jgi:CxxC motif-containing protein (DUF1111 family)
MLFRSKPVQLAGLMAMMPFVPVYFACDASAQQPTAPAQLPHDPGVRGGPAGAGGPLPGLSTPERNFFDAALDVFQEVDAVSNGLGPRFNADSCAACHAHPAVGGTSPAVNPQFAAATFNGAKNTVPSFITPDGPVREARFVTATAPASRGDRQDSHGNAQQGREVLDGGVHALYTITGRPDAPGCSLAQPDFATELAKNNVIFRTPTPLFGLGLVEDVPDSTLEANAMPGAHFNHNGNDGTIAKFGWKAQNKSLLIFAMEAYNVEQGVTNMGFPNERDDTPGCQFNVTPEDTLHLTGRNPPSDSPASDFLPDVESFAAFMRLSAPPTPAPDTPSTTKSGRQTFMRIGCDNCHVQKQTTYSGMDFFPYSDFALHSMGDGLADGIIQGNAAGDEFRTAPLWGIGQRLFFLHDGRKKDLLEAIQAHASQGSEANTVIGNFNALPASLQQDILNFLRSL